MQNNLRAKENIFSDPKIFRTQNFSDYKSNAKIEYINVRSDHPITILNKVPKGVNLRLNKLSSNKEIFDEKKSVYQEALNKYGHNYQPPWIAKNR